MLYILHGESTNPKIVMPATAKQIAEYCLQNKEVADLIDKMNYDNWVSAIITEVSQLNDIPYIEAMSLVEDNDEIKDLFQAKVDAITVAKRISLYIIKN